MLGAEAFQEPLVGGKKVPAEQRMRANGVSDRTILRFVEERKAEDGIKGLYYGYLIL